MSTTFVKVEPPFTTDLKITDGIFIKVHDVHKAQTFLPQHAHSYDHISFIAAGAAYVEQDGDLTGIRHYKAPALVFIPARVKHLFLTTEDNTRICCIHNVERTGEIEIADEHELLKET